MTVTTQPAFTLHQGNQGAIGLKESGSVSGHLLRNPVRLHRLREDVAELLE